VSPQPRMLGADGRSDYIHMAKRRVGRPSPATRHNIVNAWLADGTQPLQRGRAARRGEFPEILDARRHIARFNSPYPFGRRAAWTLALYSHPAKSRKSR
jgi:hypothetical protein